MSVRVWQKYLNFMLECARESEPESEPESFRVLK